MFGIARWNDRMEMILKKYFGLNESSYDIMNNCQLHENVIKYFFAWLYFFFAIYLNIKTIKQ